MTIEACPGEGGFEEERSSRTAGSLLFEAGVALGLFDVDAGGGATEFTADLLGVLGMGAIATTDAATTESNLDLAAALVEVTGVSTTAGKSFLAVDAAAACFATLLISN